MVYFCLHFMRRCHLSGNRCCYIKTGLSMQARLFNVFREKMELKIKRGTDLRLAGAVTDVATVSEVSGVHSVAVIPDDFPGFVPKAAVNAGDTVKAGTPILYDKYNPQVVLVSPVAGVVRDVERGARRKIERVVVDAADTADSETFDVSSREPAEIAATLCRSGLWAWMRQRPYDIVPSPQVRARDIFVSAVDSAPLEPQRVYSETDTADMATGVEVLSRLTDGHIYIGRRAGMLGDIAGAVMVNVRGPHPAGLCGVLAANIAPVNKGETIWTLSADILRRIGTLYRTGKVDFTAVVALAGAEVKHPQMLRTIVGAAVAPVLEGRLAEADHNQRVISGNVLTGVKTDAVDGYLHYPYRQITVIPEGDDVDEFMGWASLSPRKMSVSTSFPGRLCGRRLFDPDARILGGRRAMIMSGEIDRVLPMDILGEYLIKAINARDIDAMENLGIYEVAPEDFALAECLDSSKEPLQQIVRDGLDYMRREV